MGKSNRRDGQGRAKPGKRVPSILDLVGPELSPAEVAEGVAAEFADWVGAGMIAQFRLEGGVPAAEVAEALRLLRASAAEPPGLGVLSFAASLAHAEGDEQAEHDYWAQMLARVQAANDTEQWLKLVRHISGSGHPGEAVELLEPYLRDHPGDQEAAFVYAVMLQEAAGQAQPGAQEEAALNRFADRSGLAEIKRAVMAFMGRTKWDELIQNRALNDLELVPSKHLPHAVQKECAALAFEAAIRGAEEGIAGLTAKELIELYRGGYRPATALTAFAADPQSPPVLARRAADWAEHTHYGLWQLAHPSPNPGVGGTDLASGTRRYLQFPPGALDGAARWTVWLGGVIPVDGVWRVTGTGIMLSPDEGDAVAETIGQAVEKLIMTTSGGMPLAEMLPPEPIPYGKAPPWGVRWDQFNPYDAPYTQATSNTLMMLAARITADVELHRARRASHASDGPGPVTDTWPDEPLLALHGLTPRQAAQADTPYAMLLESMLRQFEYQADVAAAAGTPGLDVARLRVDLGLGGDD